MEQFSKLSAMKRMPTWPRSLVLLLLALAIASPRTLRSADLDPQLPLAQFGMDTWDGANGLPQFRIRAVIQARDGYLWLGTANGLVRFDGVDFKTFDISTGSLRDNEVSSLIEDDAGGLWIGTYGGGLTRLQAGRFTSFTVADGLPDDSIRRLGKDDKGNIWIATPKGVARLAKGVFTSFTAQNGLSGNFISAICADSSPGVFVVAGGRLNRLAGDRFEPEPGVLEEGDGRIDSMASGKDGTLWITFESGRLKSWKDGKLTTYTSRDHHCDRLGTLYADPQGTLWIGARNLLLRLVNGRFETMNLKEAGSRLGLILSMIADGEGNLWLGTEANGLSRLRSMPVRLFTTQDGLPDNSTRCIYRDRHENIWIGTYLGYARFNENQWTAYTQMEGTVVPTVTAMNEDADGRLWLAAGGRLYMRKGEKLESVPGWKKVFDIKVIGRDSGGHMWIGTDGEGLYEIADGKITAFRTEDGLPSNQIRAILCDHQGILWIGTLGGLSRFQDGKFTKFTTDDGLANNRVMSLCEDSEGILWISTRGGLSRFESGRFFNFREAEGLPDSFVFTVLDDGQGGFWLSSGKGISRVAKADLNTLARGGKQPLKVVSLGYREGLRVASLVAGTQPNACIDQAGRLLFCSLNGIVQVSLGAQTVNPRIPPVYIESVRINRSPQPADRIVEIPPGAGEVEIHYTGLSYVAPEKVQFKYQLEGIDDGWFEAGTRRFAHYAKLPPGRYRFRVIACNNDGVWNTTGASYEFRLIPHFYQARWFPPLVLLLLLGLFLSAYRLRIHKLRHNERELQRRVDEAVARVKVLSGLLPICSGCKKIRDDQGYWNQIEKYIMRYSKVEFSHGLCPDCLRRLYPDDAEEVLKEVEAEMKEAQRLKSSTKPGHPPAGPA